MTSKKLIRVYGFVIMPNHIHLIWALIAKNGKEMPHASFNKAIGHLIIKDLKQHNPGVLLFLKLMSRKDIIGFGRERSIGNLDG